MKPGLSDTHRDVSHGDILERAHYVSREMPGFTRSLYAQTFPNRSFIASEAAISLTRALAISLGEQAIQAVAANLRDDGTRTIADTHFPESHVYSPALLSFLYTRIVEWHYCETIGEDNAAHPEISDDLQVRIASDDDEKSAYAMAQLVAQSRFISAIDDFSYPLLELPAELAHAIVWAAARHIEKCGLTSNTDMAKAARKALSNHDESESRLKMLQEHVNRTIKPNYSCNMAAIGKFGVSHFFAMLSEKIGLPTDEILILSSAQDRAAFAVILRAAKCPTKDIAKIVNLLKLPGQYQDVIPVTDINMSAAAAQDIVVQWTPHARGTAW
ncbi:hypothetical protein [Sphingorhabdus sp. Alg239-R122]|uniref:hypothetical protein n=1 Tax=Sphingorhabdus sp. Alg239-R122 TaxID=2305989 RepID=UPI0013DC8ACF|nr:hypothetical protein [Sphingorhabdus sp. Alg239-R122]